MKPTLTTIDQLSPTWLSHVLGTDVREVTADRLGTGQIGRVYRMHVHAEDLPSTLIMKLPTDNADMRPLLHGVYRAEVAFYADMAAHMSIKVPDCYYAQMGEQPGEFTLILEDKHLMNPGDQITGLDSDELTEAAIDNLTGLHAYGWCDEEKCSSNGFARADSEAAENLAQASSAAAQPFIAELSHLLGPGVADVLVDSLQLAGQWQSARGDRFGFIHGDYRLDNLLFSDSESHAVDWQTLAVGLPARDVSFFMGTSLPSAYRKNKEQDLVSRYHQGLTNLGVSNYSVEQAWDDYVFGLLQGSLITTLGWMYGQRSERGDLMFATMANRVAAAMNDHDALTVISKG